MESAHSADEIGSRTRDDRHHGDEQTRGHHGVRHARASTSPKESKRDRQRSKHGDSGHRGHDRGEHRVGRDEGRHEPHKDGPTDDVDDSRTALDRKRSAHPDDDHAHRGHRDDVDLADGKSHAPPRATVAVLPIAAYQSALVEAVEQSAVVVVVGETGSGKTTQLPQYLLDASVHRGKPIVVTQPRRVAAISVATRVASERGCRVGDEVGYEVRFEKAAGPDTMIKCVSPPPPVAAWRTDFLGA